jgi:hypothetical protein
MTETNHISVSGNYPPDDRTIKITPEELEIIGYFTRGQKHAISSQNLKLEYTETSIRLSNTNGKLLGISKQVNQWQRKVLISNNSVYKSSNVRALTELGFIAKQKSSHPDFDEYHHYAIPAGYKLNYTEAIQLWKIWWNNKRYQLDPTQQSIEILTFSKGNWQVVQDLQPKQGKFILRTGRGEIEIEPDEYVVWIDSLATAQPKFVGTLSHPISLEPAQKLSANPSVRLDPNLLSEQNTAGEFSPSSIRFSDRDRQPIMAKLDGSIEGQLPENLDRHILSQKAYIDRLPEPEEDIDLESYLSTFNTEDTEDVDRIEGIYNIDELLSGNIAAEDLFPPPPPRSMEIPQAEVAIHLAQQESLPTDLEQSVESPLPIELKSPSDSEIESSLSILQRQASLKQKAIEVLANYLQKGDRIVRTEVLKNAQGQEINRKVTKIQRGCPSWAIEQIKKLEQ